MTSPFLLYKFFNMIEPLQIKTLAEKYIDGSDKFIVDVKVLKGNRIIILMDADSSVTINDCAQLNKFIESKLNRDAEDFELEVSSAGLDNPLVLTRQFKKNIGRQIKIIQKDGIIKTGTIIQVTENEIHFAETVLKKINNKKEITQTQSKLDFEKIKEIRLVVNI